MVLLMIFTDTFHSSYIFFNHHYEPVFFVLRQRNCTGNQKYTAPSDGHALYCSSNKRLSVALRESEEACNALWVERSRPIKVLLSMCCYGANGGDGFESQKNLKLPVFVSPHPSVTLTVFARTVFKMSTDRLDALRGRNKHLLNQLLQQKQKLERLSGCTENRKREREEDEVEEPEEMVTLTDGDRGPARAALSKPTVRFADACEKQSDFQETISSPSSTFKRSTGTAKHTMPSDFFKGSRRHLQVHNRLQDTRPFSTKSCLVNHSKEHRDVHSRVTFQSDECEDTLTSNRQQLPPLLGYDWIAGVLDTEDSLVERPDEFFNVLRTFRSLHKDECVNSARAEFSEEHHSVPTLLTDTDDPKAHTDSHQCTFSYRINSRLFPVPLHSQECCPVCKRHKSSHPHSTADPALVRVSIPLANLLPPHKYKAHRRCSFNPSDSLGLPSHCLSGWSSSGQGTLTPTSSLDLRSSLNLKSSIKELEDLSALKASSNHDQISDVSRLARHNFHHFSPKRKLGSASYPVC